MVEQRYPTKLSPRTTTERRTHKATRLQHKTRWIVQAHRSQKVSGYTQRWTKMIYDIYYIYDIYIYIRKLYAIIFTYIHMWYAMLRFLWQTLWFYDSLSNWLLSWKQPGGCSGEKWHCKCPWWTEVSDADVSCLGHGDGPINTHTEILQDLLSFLQFLITYMFSNDMSWCQQKHRLERETSSTSLLRQLEVRSMWHLVITLELSIFGSIITVFSGGLGSHRFYGRARILLPSTQISWAAFPSEIVYGSALARLAGFTKVAAERMTMCRGRLSGYILSLCAKGWLNYPF